MGALTCFFVEVDQLTSACGEIHFFQPIVSNNKKN